MFSFPRAQGTPPTLLNKRERGRRVHAAWREWNIQAHIRSHQSRSTDPLLILTPSMCHAGNRFSLSLSPCPWRRRTSNCRNRVDRSSGVRTFARVDRLANWIVWFVEYTICLLQEAALKWHRVFFGRDGECTWCSSWWEFVPISSGFLSLFERSNWRSIF